MVPASLEVTPAQALLEVGDSVALHITLRDRNGQPVDPLLFGVEVSWSSQDSSIATVGQGGVAYGHHPGLAEVRASAGGVVGQALIEVRHRLESLDLALALSDVEGVVGNTLPDEIQARVVGPEGLPVSGVLVTFSVLEGGGSTDPPSAVTDTSGDAASRWTLGPSAGDQTLEVRAEGHAYTTGDGQGSAPGPQSRGPAATVRARAKPGPAVEIPLSPPEIQLPAGASALLSAAAEDRYGNPVPEDRVRWPSSDPSVASVDGTGLVFAASPGMATVTARANSASAEATVQVSGGVPAYLDIMSGNDQVGPVGTKLGEPLVVRATDSMGTAIAGVLVTWAVGVGSGSTSQATVSTDADGLAAVEWTLGTPSGIQTATARADGLQEVAFSATGLPGPVHEVTVRPASAEVTAGDRLHLSATAEDQYGNLLEDITFSWSSSDPSVATVDSSGWVTAVAAGNTTIRASSESAAGTASVSVQAPPPQAAECGDPDPEWIWCDDFEQDRLSSYFEYSDSDDRFIRSSGVGVDGSTGMRARWETGRVGAGNLHLAFGRTPSPYMRPVDDGTVNYRQVYWRMYLRHQPGWTGGGADKLSRAMIFATSGWAQAMIGHVWSSGATNEQLAVDPASGTDETGNLKSTKYNDFDNLRWLGLARSDAPIFDSDHVGRWYCIEARVRLNDPGQSNGLFQLWIDGIQEAERTGLNWVGAYDAYGINAIFFENYWNSGSPVDQERYFDNIVVSTTRIGCL
jgi:uncharacterized protein YjdB